MRLDIEIDEKEGLISVTGPDWVIKNVPALRRRLFKVFTYNHEKSIFQAGINKESVNLLIKIGISREHKIKLQSLIRENIYRLDLNIDEEEHCIKVTGPKFVIENITSVRKRLFELFTFNEEEAIFQTEISKKAVDLLVSIGLTNQQEHQLKEALGQSDTGDVFNVGQDYGTEQKYSEGQTTNSKYSSFDSDKSCGKFIRSLKHPNYGVGKLLSKKSDCVEIEYFDSPMTADRKTVCVKERDTEKVRLSHQTRAYFLDPKSRSWQIGRIAGHIDEDCFIYLPNKQREKLSEQEVYVRWDREIEDPAEHLAAQLTETPFFHDARSKLLESLVKQRAACSGISALLSAPVSLERHQVEVVRRVLEDPIQRYLLADEVGLGKTIEAGIILRQFLLDQPDDHQVVVIAPEALIDQWINELRQRCQIGAEFGHSIKFISIQTVTEKPDELEDMHADFLIIDEAHQAVIGWDHSDNDSLQLRYKALSHFSNPVRTKRLLLLSATPVRRNEDGFLALLHLLDPSVYDLTQIDAFRTKVENRQDLADKFHSFTEDQMSLFLEGMVNDLGEMFPNDSRLHQVLEELKPSLKLDVDENSPERRSAIRAVRVHLSETYRLHRRLIRNRRSEELRGLLPGRSGLRQQKYDDDAFRLIEDHLETWRVSASSHVWGKEDSTQSTYLNRIFCLLLDLVFCDLNALKNFIFKRLNLDGDGLECMPEPFSVEIEDLLQQPTELFPEEGVLLQEMLSILDGFDNIHEQRLDALDDLVRDCLQENQRVVVFVTAPSFADEVNTYLEDLHTEPVFRHSSENDDWVKFTAVKQPSVLVCDYRAEEGLNLQGGDACIVHGDIPISPNRIEQRIGRLDRFGVGREVRSLTLLPDNCPYHKAWQDSLSQAYEVFSKSIAALQYVIVDEVGRVRKSLLGEGIQCILDSTQALQGAEGLLGRELSQIRAQDELDAIEVLVDEEETDLTQRIEDYEDQNDFQGILENWLLSRLQFNRRERHRDGNSGLRWVRGSAPQQNVLQYQYTPEQQRRPTLVSLRDFDRWFKCSFQNNPRQNQFMSPFTWDMSFDRETARCRDAGLARIGNNFIDCLHEHVRVDDRGTSFAFWRHSDIVPESQVCVYFCFDFLVEIGDEKILSLAEQDNGLGLYEMKRRGDSVFTPITRSIWINEDLEEPEQDVLSELCKGYSNRDDKNLNVSRWKTLKDQAVFDADNWPDLCRITYQHSRKLLIQKLDLKQLIETSVNRFKKQTEVVEGQFQSRLDALKENSFAETELQHAEQDMAREMLIRDALLHDTQNPKLRLDAAGAVFLAGKPFPGDEG